MPLIQTASSGDATASCWAVANKKKLEPLVSVSALDKNWFIVRDLKSESAKKVGLRPEVRAKFIARIAKANANPEKKAARIEKTRQIHIANRALIAEKTRKQFSDPAARLAQSERIRKYYERLSVIIERCKSMVALLGSDQKMLSKKAGSRAWESLESELSKQCRSRGLNA